MAIIPSLGNLQLPPQNISPGSPFTYEEAVDLFQQIASANSASGLTAHGTSISDATTNTALVTIPNTITENAQAGNAWELAAYGIVSMPASGQPTLAFNGYSGGSAGTALATMTAFTPTASLAAALFEVYMRVQFYSATTVQCIVKATISSSTSTAAASLYLAGNNSATPVTVTQGTSLTLNMVMGSAVASSSYEQLDGYWDQVA
jgi:hypothetical protein